MITETSLGAAYAWDNTDAPVETRTPFRLSLGEQITTVVPQGENVIVTQVVVTPSGMFETETQAIDFGTGGLSALVEEAPGSTDLAAQFAQNQAIAEAERQAQAIDAAWREANSLAQQQIADFPAPPSESAPPPAPTGGGDSGATEAPITSAPGEISQEAQPTTGCETVEETIFDPFTGVTTTLLTHFTGVDWDWVGWSQTGGV